MTIALCLFTDGRKDCFDRTIQSLARNLTGNISRWLIINDSTDPGYRKYLDEFYAFEIHHAPERRGFAGTYHYAWQLLAQMSEVDYVASWEDDFVLREPVNLDQLTALLKRQPHLDQLALLRGPVNVEEQRAGGVMEVHPHDFAERCEQGVTWVEHRRFFTTNPSVYRRDLCKVGWPECQHSEGVFTHLRLEDPERRFGYWGPRGRVLVDHIGTQRVGTGY